MILLSSIKNNKVDLKLKHFSFIFGFIILFAIIYTIACPTTDHWKGIQDDQDKTVFDKFFNRLYFSLTTMTTIGYGDIAPVSKRARSIVLLQMFIFVIKLIIIF